MSSTITNYYKILGVEASASSAEIRQAYRELCKRYHPDTTDLPDAIAIDKFRQIKEAYGTLIQPEKRAIYDLQIKYLLSPPPPPSGAYNPIDKRQKYVSNSGYLDPTDRPLSPGEILLLLVMVLTLLGCLGLAIVIALLRGELSLTP
jgi:curved DNA-binding protein CbpA